MGTEWFEGQRGSILEPTHWRHPSDASGSQEFGYDIFPRQTNTLLTTVNCVVISVAPSPQGELFATGSGDMRARIWK